MKKPTWILLSIIVLLGAILVLRSALEGSSRGDGRSGLAVETPRASDESAPERKALLEPTPPSETPASFPENALVAPDAAEAQRVATRDGGGRKLRGVVARPAGTPPDDSLRVLVLDQALDLRQVYGAVQERDGHGSKHVLERAVVADDGSFRLALATESDVWLALDGRYLYSARTLRVAAGDGEVVLPAELGGLVRGTIEFPAGAQAEPDGVVLSLASATQAATASQGSLARASRAEASGAFELRAVPAGTMRVVTAEVSGCAAFRSKGFEVQAGGVSELRVEFQLGATVRGTVRDARGATVAEAGVVISEEGPFGFPGEEHGSTTTDASGAFELLHIVPGKLVVRASKNGYLDSEGLKLTLADRDERTGLALVLESGAGIAGRVAFSDGAAAAHATVKVSFDPEAMVGLGALGALRGADGTSTCDEAGRFEVWGLGKGPFLVRASRPRAGADGVEEEWRAKASGVKPDTRDLALTLAPPASLSGRVLDGTGVAVVRFHVQATTAASGFVPGKREGRDFENEGGHFVMRGLEPGAYRVSAQADGFGPMEPLDVVLPQPDQAELELVLPPAASVAGKVIDPAGQPVAGASVTVLLDPARRMEALRGNGQPPTAVSDEDGAFLLAGLAVGASSIVARREGFAMSEPATVEATPGAPTATVVLVLRNGALVTGEVFGATGKPAAGVQVMAQQVGIFETSMTTSDEEGRFRFEHLTPGSWSVTAILLPAEGDGGSAEDASRSFMENMRMAMVDLADGAEEHVVLGAPPEDPVRVLGRVTHAGQPVSGGVLSFVAQGSKGLEAMKLTSLDPEGRYEVELGAPGRYLLSVQISSKEGGFQQNNIEFRATIPQAPEHRLDLELPLGGIRGHVRFDGKPSGGTRVTLTTEGGLQSGSFLGGHYSETITDERGAFAFDYLHPGRYAVAAGGAMFGGAFGGQGLAGRRIESGLEIEEGHVLEGVDFELVSPGDIKGRVRDPSGAAVKDASIFVRDAEGNPLDRFSMIASGADGSFSYTGLAPGEYQVSARGKERASGEGVVARVKTGETAEVELVVYPGTTLEVEVLDAAGEPLEARVSVIDGHGRSMQGLFGFGELSSAFSGGLDSTLSRVGPLAPGRYTVEAVAEDGKHASKSVELDGQPTRRLKLRLR